MVRNDRGGCLCGAIVCEGLMPGVVMVSTGAWFDPAETGDAEARTCRHGNPNVLAPDIATSPLSQGPAAHSCLVEVTPYEGPPVEVTAFRPPRLMSRGEGDAG